MSRLRTLSLLALALCLPSAPAWATGFTDIGYDVPLREWRDHVFQTQNSLRLLAELTGGMAVVNRNDFVDAFREIDAETSDYYVLGFYSSNPDPTVRTRRLRVEVNREGVDLRHRTHYSFPLPPDDQVIQ